MANVNPETYKTCIDTHALAKPGVVKEKKPDWGAVLYKVGGKYFILLPYDAAKDGEDTATVSSYAQYDEARDNYIAVKHDPLKGEILRQNYTGITEAYYHNKKLWSAIALDGTVPEAVMQEMIDDSYDLVFAKLTKKLQNEILSQHDQSNH